MGVAGITINLDPVTGEIFYDLKTGAKSHLYLYEDLRLKGRYGYESKLDTSCYPSVESVAAHLFIEFEGCLHGRDFYNETWMELGVKLGLVKKPKKKFEGE